MRVICLCRLGVPQHATTPAAVAERTTRLAALGLQGFATAASVATCWPQCLCVRVYCAAAVFSRAQAASYAARPAASLASSGCSASLPPGLCLSAAQARSLSGWNAACACGSVLRRGQVRLWRFYPVAASRAVYTPSTCSAAARHSSHPKFTADFQPTPRFIPQWTEP